MTHRWTAGLHREVLANGLTLLIQPLEIPAVAVVTWVRAGFFDEPDAWAGISHVLEHMYFKGTPSRGPGVIARDTKAAGGYLNAGTGYDHTSYYTVLPPAGLAKAIAIQADALQHPLLDPDELARELQVIIQEAKRKLDSPPAVAWETLHEVMYDRHPIRRWRIGYESVLAGFTHDDVRGYYATRYVPERTIVAIAGGLDRGEALRLARAAYADWPGRTGSVPPPIEEVGRGFQRCRTLRGDVVQSELMLGWRGVPPLHPMSPALDLLATVLGAGRAARLQRRIRETGLASNVLVSHYSPTELGVFALGATCEPERCPEVVAATAEEVARVRSTMVRPEELARARTLMLAGRARRLESAEGRASGLAAAEALGDVEELNREEEKLEAVTEEDILEAARTYLPPDVVSGVVYHPANRGEDLSVDVLRAFGTARPQNGSPVPPVTITPPTPGRVLHPATGLRTVGGVHHWTVPGVDLLVARKRGTPLATVGVFRSRAGPEPMGSGGIGALAVRTAVRGAGGLDAGGLAEAFERLGGTVAPSVSHDRFGFSCTVLPERIADAALFLALVLRAPDFAPETVATERRMQAEDARRAADDMFRYPVQLALAARFGDTGYGLPVIGTVESLDRLDAARVQGWHRGEMARGRSAVIVVADLDPEAVAETLVRAFATEGEGLPPERTPPPGPSPRSSTPTRVVERDRAQTAVAMFFPGPSRRDPDRFSAEIWAAIAGGLGGRMFESLRSQRSLAYAVVASSWQRPHAGGVFTYIATSPDREEEARDAMLAEIDRFRRDPVTEEELHTAAAYLAGQTTVSRQIGASLAAEMADVWLEGEGLEELEDPGAPYLGVDRDRVLSFADRCLDPAMRVEGIVRGTGGGR